MTEPRKIFLSYAAEDSKWARWIAWILKEEGAEVRYMRNFRHHFVKEMDEAVEWADCTVGLLSPSAMVSRWTRMEWSAALTRQNLVLIRVEECQPDGVLRPAIYADLVGTSAKEARHEIVRRLWPARATMSAPPVFPGPEAGPVPEPPSSRAHEVPGVKDPVLKQGKIGKGYSITKRIGQGAMGSVYLAVDSSTPYSRMVVVKTPHPQLLETPGFAEKFRREIQALFDLVHPRIPRIYDAGTIDGTPDGLPFFVMDYLSGGSLEERLAGLGRPQSPSEVCRWLEPVAEALDFIHHEQPNGLLHRDVKPGNILFDRGGNAFLSDFGLIRGCVKGDSSLSMHLKELFQRDLGTPVYMAPEQVEQEALTPAADQYALAATVYEALSGQPPFEGSPKEIAAAKLKAGPRPLHSVTPVSLEVSEVVHKAMSREPHDRFESCGALARALQDAAPPDDSPEATPQRWLVPATVCVLVAASVSTLLLLPGAEIPATAGLGLAVLCWLGFSLSRTRDGEDSATS